MRKEKIYKEQKKKFWKGLQIIIAIFVGVLGLFVSVWEGCENRQNNRLMVSPLLNFVEGYSNKDPHYYGLILKNIGYGPAIIESIKFYYNGKPLQSWNGHLKEFIDSGIGFPPPGYSGSSSIPMKNEAIPVDNEINIFGVAGTVNEGIEPFIQKLDSISIIIDYKSIYNIHKTADFHPELIVKKTGTNENRYPK